MLLRCSVLQCVEVCCSVLQCVAVRHELNLFVYELAGTLLCLCTHVLMNTHAHMYA